MMRPPAANPDESSAGTESGAVELVVAVAENDAIGRANGLPWRLSSDLKRFKALTLGKTILMGRRTHESIGKALPGRRNVVLTHSPTFNAPDCLIVRSFDEARLSAASAPLMVIGGAEIYRQCLPLAQQIHLTLVHARIADADTFFDGWRGAEWRETFRERHPADDRNDFDYSFVMLERAKAG